MSQYVLMSSQNVDDLGRRIFEAEGKPKKIPQPPKTNKPKAPTEFLKNRDKALLLGQDVGKRTIITEIGSKTEGGYYCQTCSVLLKDSSAWLDHINGKAHNGKLGMSMKIQRSTLSGVQQKLKAIREAKAAKAAMVPPAAEGSVPALAEAIEQQTNLLE